jgi:hypothetical protein
MKITIKNNGVEWIITPENEDELNRIDELITDCICGLRNYAIIKSPDSSVMLTQGFLQNSLIVVTK